MRRCKKYRCYTNQTLRSCHCKDCKNSMMCTLDSYASFASKEDKVKKLRLHKLGFIEPNSNDIKVIYSKKLHKRRYHRKGKRRLSPFRVMSKLEVELRKNELIESLSLYSISKALRGV